MALLRNNNVYVFSILPIKAWYHSYNAYVISKMTEEKISVTFNEDMKALIDRMNGITPLSKYNDYFDITSNYIPEVSIERQQMLDRMWDMIQSMCVKVFTEYPGAPTTDIFFHYDNQSIYILDRRKMTYVPNGFCHPISATGGEPLFDDDAWV